MATLEAEKTKIAWGAQQAKALWDGLYSRYDIQVDGSVILDYGCSWGYMLKYLLENHSPRGLIGVDIAPLWEEVRAEWQPPEDRISFYSGELPGIEAIEDGSVDYVLCTSVLQYLRPEQLLSSLERIFDILRPGGELVLRTRCFTSYIGADLHSHYDLECPHLLYPLSAFWQDMTAQGKSPRYLNHLTSSNYVAYFYQSGFEVIDLRRRSDRRSPETHEKIRTLFPDIPDEELKCAELEARLLRPIQEHELRSWRGS